MRSASVPSLPKSHSLYRRAKFFNWLSGSSSRQQASSRQYTLSRYSLVLVTSGKRIYLAEMRGDPTGKGDSMHPTTGAKQTDLRSHADEKQPFQQDIREERGPAILGDTTVNADVVNRRRQTVNAHGGNTHYLDPDALEVRTELGAGHSAASKVVERPTAIQQQRSRLNHGDTRHPARQSRDSPWLRGLVGLFIAAGIGAAAFVSQSSYRDAVARWTPQLISASSLSSEKPVAINSRERRTQAQVTAATAVAERVSAATAIAILMARPEIKSLSDLAGTSIAIDDKQSSASSIIRTAMAAAGAAEVHLTAASQTNAIDRVIGGEVPASVLTLASPEAAEGFPEIAGFKIFRLPLYERGTRSP